MAQQPPGPPDETAPPGDGEPANPPPPPPSMPPAPAGAPGTGWAGPDYQLPVPSDDDPTGYLRSNAGRYTREALTARLAAAGHPADAIAAAWATVDAEDAAEGRRDRRGSVSRLIAGAYLLTWMGITAAWLVSNAGQVGSVALVSGMLAFFLFVPGFVGFLVARGSRRLRRAGTGTAVAYAVVPLLILAALAGACVAIVPPSGFG